MSVDWKAMYEQALRKKGEMVDRAVRAERERDAAVADAWDEGWEACHAFMGRGIFPPRTNPYREPVDGAEGDGRADQ